MKLPVVYATWLLHILLAAASALLSGETLAALINAQATVRQSYPFPLTDSVSGTSNGSTPLINSVSLNGNTASFTLSPAQNSGSITGSSAQVDFNDWLRFGIETSAEAFVQMTGTFSILTPGDFQFSVKYSGIMIPNTVFEQEYQQLFGSSTVTARTNVDLYFGSPGNFYVHTPHQLLGDSANPAFLLVQSVADTATSTNQDFAFSLTIGAIGSRGGSFNMTGNATIPTSSATAGIQGADILDMSFIEFELLVPPGTIVSTDVPYLHIVTTPVPAAVWLFASGLVGLLVMARRKAS